MKIRIPPAQVAQFGTKYLSLLVSNKSGKNIMLIEKQAKKSVKLILEIKK